MIFRSQDHEENTTLLDEVIRAYISYALKYKKLVQSCGSDFLIVIQPDGHVIDERLRKDSWQGQEYKIFRLALAKELTAHGIDYIDINDFRSRFRKDMFMDAIHLDSSGNELIADIILENLPDGMCVR